MVESFMSFDKRFRELSETSQGQPSGMKGRGSRRRVGLRNRAVKQSSQGTLPFDECSHAYQMIGLSENLNLLLLQMKKHLDGLTPQALEKSSECKGILSVCKGSLALLDSARKEQLMECALPLLCAYAESDPLERERLGLNKKLLLIVLSCTTSEERQEILNRATHS